MLLIRAGERRVPKMERGQQHQATLAPVSGISFSIVSAAEAPATPSRSLTVDQPAVSP